LPFGFLATDPSARRIVGVQAGAQYSVHVYSWAWGAKETSISSRRR
jgi:hypothetical protein